jgi:hypothetical protein
MGLAEVPESMEVRNDGGSVKTIWIVPVINQTFELFSSEIALR